MTLLPIDGHPDTTSLLSAEEISVRNISERHWETLLSARRVIRLSLYHITAPTLPSLHRLTEIRSLSMTWATKIASIEPVFKMAELTSLTISDFPKLQQLDGIEQLVGLTRLRLAGNEASLTPPLKLASIAPVAKLPSLTVFSLNNAKLTDDSIEALGDCRQLQQLQLSNQFEKSQYAYLAKRLNHQLDEPIEAHRASVLRCKTCGGYLRLVTGRRAPFVCSSCDSAKLAKLEAEFARLVEAA